MNLQTIGEKENNSQEVIAEPNKYLHHSFYFWATLIPILFGSKDLIISKTMIDPFWILFIESCFLILFWVSLTIMLYAYIGWSRISLYDYLFRYISIFQSYKIILLALLAGMWHIIASFILILAKKFNTMSGGSIGPMLCTLTINTLICLAWGKFFFQEKHPYRQYLGGVIVIASTVLIIIWRTFEFGFTISITENLYFILSLILSLVASSLWAVPIIWGKYSIYYYDIHPVEFGVLSLTFSGIFGFIVLLLVVLLTGTPLHIYANQSSLFNVIRVGFSAIFTLVGYLTIYKSVSLGNMGTAQLFLNTKIAIMVIEEFLFIGDIPNITVTSISKFF